MDPEATLTELRRLCDAPEPDGERLAELFDALDEWISRGGFLPAEWGANRAPNRALAP